jgi:hypothetical protein
VRLQLLKYQFMRSESSAKIARIKSFQDGFEGALRSLVDQLSCFGLFDHPLDQANPGFVFF